MRSAVGILAVQGAEDVKLAKATTVILTQDQPRWLGGIEHLSQVWLSAVDVYISWREVPVVRHYCRNADIGDEVFIHADLYKLAAICLFLEDRGIEPNVDAVQMINRVCETALMEPSQKYLLIYSLNPVAQTLGTVISIFPPCSGNMAADIADINRQVEQAVQLIEREHSLCTFYHYLICTQEDFRVAERSITLNALNRYTVQSDIDDAQAQRIKADIVFTLKSAVDSIHLPSAQAVQDRLLRPYIFKTVAMRARQGLTKRSCL